MIKLNYSKDYIELFHETSKGELVEIDNWTSIMDNPVYFNICNDLIVNGTATSINAKKVIINYEDISQIDSFEYMTLGLPETYPYDIFIDILGAGFTDKNLKIKCSFQDFAHGNGSGNNLFFEIHRTGGYLNNNELEFLLSSKQYLLLSEIERINNTQFQDTTAVFKEVSKIQNIAVDAKVVLSKTLQDTLVVVPEKIKFDITPIGDDKYKLSPIIEDANAGKFKD